MTFEEKSVPLSVGEITCRVGGEGPSGLYLHSAGGFRQTAALEELARRFRIHAPIMPGFDGTPALEAVASMRDLARLADEFAAAVIGGECDVIGHSFGGWIAVWLAVQYPTRVGQLVLEAPAGFRVGGAGGLPTDPAALRKAMFAHPENLPTEQKSDEMVALNREMLGVYNQNTAFDEALGVEPIVSADRRTYFYDLRPYAERMRATLAEVARAQRDAEHPLLAVRQSVRASELVVVTSDRGLCGAFNNNVIKRAEQVVRERTGDLTLTTAGKKAREYFQRGYRDRLGGHYPQEGWVTYGQATEIARRVSQRFEDGEVDEVVLVYSEFVSAVTQTPRIVRLLPFAAETGEEEEQEALPYEIEPDPARLLAVLVPKAIEVTVFRALLENQAGEHAARMAAMESATRNTEELIDSLTLEYNRARQAAITKELVEIVSGAEAL